MNSEALQSGIASVISAAAGLKELRARSVPRLTVRGMADKLGMPLSSYARYEDPSDYKKPHLPLPLARKVARVLSDYGVDPTDALALGGIQQEEAPAHLLSASEEEWLDLFGRLSAGQRKLVLQVAREMLGGDVEDAPSPNPSIHSPKRGPEAEEARR